MNNLQEQINDIFGTTDSNLTEDSKLSPAFVQKVELALNKLTGQKLKYKIDARSLVSNNFANKITGMNHMFKELQVRAIFTKVSKGAEWYVDVSYQYKHPSSSNGYTFAGLWFDMDGKLLKTAIK